MSRLKYYPIELHSHTYHSDGKFSSKDLLENAKDFGYEAIFLTDHNTNAGLDEIYEQGLDKEIIPVFPGIEWTTFFGHMLILGTKDAGNYTLATLDNIEECIDDIKTKNPDAIIGMAHPFDIGNPICTGCHFEYTVNDYSKFSYIELVNSENSHASKSTLKAYDRWIELLKEGYKLAALSGRDWHVESNPDETVAVSMLGIEGEVTNESTLDAIRNLHTYITYGPILDLKMDTTDLGDEISNDFLNGSLSISKPHFKNNQNLHIKPTQLVIYNNENVVFESTITYDEKVDLEISNLHSGYIRIEILGEMKALSSQRLVIASPIFIK